MQRKFGIKDNRKGIDVDLDLYNIQVNQKKKDIKKLHQNKLRLVLGGDHKHITNEALSAKRKNEFIEKIKVKHRIER